MYAFLLAACQQSTGFQKPDTAETTDSGSPYTLPTDTDPTDDGDADNDGYTVEEGDCDDADVHASPAREEDDGDGIDNDCDGKVDEAFVGLTVVHYDGAGADILSVNKAGAEEGSVPITSEDCSPVWLDHHGDGWVVNNGYAYVTLVDAAGACTDLGDFSDVEVYPYGVYGVTAAPDGTIYATTLDKLYTVGLDGTVTEVASWACDLAAPDKHDLAAYSLAVDVETGEVGLFGYFGGFATWTAEGGVVMRATEDLYAPGAYTWSGAKKDGGGWFSPGVTKEGTGILRFDLDAGTWVTVESWKDEDWTPFALALDSDEGDFYVTATAGWYATLWRIVHGTGYTADLYVTNGLEPESFYGVVADYRYGG